MVVLLAAYSDMKNPTLFRADRHRFEPGNNRRLWTTTRKKSGDSLYGINFINLRFGVFVVGNKGYLGGVPMQGHEMNTLPFTGWDAKIQKEDYITYVERRYDGTSMQPFDHV